MSEAGSPPSNASAPVRDSSGTEPLGVEILAHPRLTAQPTWLIFLSPSGLEDALFLAIADALGSAFPVALIRPSFATYGRDLYAMELLGADIHDAIRGAIGSAKFVIGGFCYGGLLAMEVARQQPTSG